MSRTFILLLSLAYFIVVFVLHHFLYSGPRSGDAGIVFIALGFLLLLNIAIINLTPLIVHFFNKIYKIKPLGIVLLGVIGFEGVSTVVFDQPAFFGLFGKEPLNLKNDAFVFSLCNLFTLIILFVGGQWIYDRTRASK